ncbi:hypothetical protein OC846_000906 [Tilletia horrida]|uniref:Structure-specific endonuclease subunit SLX4 n=1 Tax=Tilletia horrida TaxID=155126 RepID=A0AAN6JWJ3_9BASI|nr:hypothetical protein OC846_000906 [Tilletia horrida]
MVIDLTQGSSDEDIHLTEQTGQSEHDDSVIFVSEHTRPSSSFSDAVNPFTRPHVPERLDWQGARGHSISMDKDMGLPMETDDPVAIDSDMGDETRQLISEMLKNDNKEALQIDDDDQSFTSFEDEAPLAALSLSSPQKRPRGRPRKLALGTRGSKIASKRNDDGNDDDDPDDEADPNIDEDDEEDVEAEPDSIYVSANLSRALALTVRADTQLWDRILRFEPIPLEELTSCASKGASLFAQHQQSGNQSHGRHAGDTSESSSHDLAKAWKEWNHLLAGSQKRLELAIQSWADEQGICSFFDEGRHDKRKAAAQQRRERRRSASLSSEDDFSSPTKKRRSQTTSARGSRGKGKGKSRS